MIIRGPGQILLIPGIILIALGVAIFIMPDLLAFIVAAGFIFVGGVFVSIGLRAQSLDRRIRDPWSDL